MKKKKEGNKGTEARILTAAVREFIEYGYYGARMQRIADRAKVNKALVHYYFRNKEKVYEEIIVTGKDLILRRLSLIENDNKPVEEKLEEIMDAYIEVMTDKSEYPRVMIYEVLRGGRLVLKQLASSAGELPFNPFTGKIYKYFQKKIKAGEIKKIDIFQLVISIVSQIVPVYFARDIFKGIAGVMGLNSVLFNKMLSERKKFVINLIMEGIKNKGVDK